MNSRVQMTPLSELNPNSSRETPGKGTKEELSKAAKTHKRHRYSKVKGNRIPDTVHVAMTSQSKPKLVTRIATGTCKPVSDNTRLGKLDGTPLKQGRHKINLYRLINCIGDRLLQNAFSHNT